LIVNWLFLYRGPPRFEGERRFGGDRDGYRGGPRGEFGGDKGGAPADYRPSFGVSLLFNSMLHLFLAGLSIFGLSLSSNVMS